MADKTKGILLSESGDLYIKVERNDEGLITAGLIIGDVTAQNQRNIIFAEKGDIKYDPLLGVGASSYLDDDDPSAFLREVRINLRNDGQKVKSCGFDENGKLIIIGSYDN